MELTKPQEERRDSLILTVKQKLGSIFDAGLALSELRDSKLYAATHRSFDVFCKEVFGIGKSQAYRIIESTSIIKKVSRARDENTLSSHRQVQALAKAPPESRIEVLDAAIADAPKDANGHPVLTAKIVREAVKKIVDPEPEPEETEPPARSKITAPEPEIPTDANGTPLPDKPNIREAFEQGAIFDDLMNRLSQIKSVATKITDEGAFQFNRQQFEAHVKNARAELKFGRPYAVCPYCKATPQKIKCNACKGHGWVRLSTYEGAPSEMKVTA